MAGHSQFKNIMHPQGPAGRGQVQAVLQARARNHRRRQGRRRPTPTAIRGSASPSRTAKAQSMPKDNIERAINKAVGRRRGDLRGGALRGLRPGRRGADRRGADRQPQPHGRRGALLFHQARRGDGRDRLGRLHVRPRRRDRLSGVGRRRRTVLEAAIEAGAERRHERRRRPCHPDRVRGSRHGRARARREARRGGIGARRLEAADADAGRGRQGARR